MRINDHSVLVTWSFMGTTLCHEQSITLLQDARDTERIHAKLIRFGNMRLHQISKHIFMDMYTIYIRGIHVHMVNVLEPMRNYRKPSDSHNIVQKGVFL